MVYIAIPTLRSGFFPLNYNQNGRDHKCQNTTQSHYLFVHLAVETSIGNYGRSAKHGHLLIKLSDLAVDVGDLAERSE